MDDSMSEPTMSTDALSAWGERRAAIESQGTGRLATILGGAPGLDPSQLSEQGQRILVWLCLFDDWIAGGVAELLRAAALAALDQQPGPDAEGEADPPPLNERTVKGVVEPERVKPLPWPDTPAPAAPERLRELLDRLEASVTAEGLYYGGPAIRDVQQLIKAFREREAARQDEYEGVALALRQMVSDRDHAERQVAELRGLLDEGARYGIHDADCAVANTPADEAETCTCGFAQWYDAAISREVRDGE